MGDLAAYTLAKIAQSSAARLARSLLEWARIEGTEPDPAVRSFDVVSQRYEREVMPTKAPRTQRDNLIELDKLRAVFGRMLIDAIKPHHARGYLDARGADRQNPRQPREGPAESPVQQGPRVGLHRRDEPLPRGEGLHRGRP